ncbi:MAG: hypothetical protein MET45_20420 [Nostoc sp. LLA-1]|nr:hypothetical protein [Cyanocohniella sp. LLY]
MFLSDHRRSHMTMRLPDTLMDRELKFYISSNSLSVNSLIRCVNRSQAIACRSVATHL